MSSGQVREKHTQLTMIIHPYIKEVCSECNILGDNKKGGGTNFCLLAICALTWASTLVGSWTASVPKTLIRLEMRTKNKNRRQWEILWKASLYFVVRDKSLTYGYLWVLEEALDPDELSPEPPFVPPSVSVASISFAPSLWGKLRAWLAFRCWLNGYKRRQ